MQCPRCRAIPESGDKFCGRCGEPFTREYSYETRETSPLPKTPKQMNSAEIKYKLGLIYLKKGKFQEAIAMWHQVLASDPGHYDAQRMLSEVQSQRQ